MSYSDKKLDELIGRQRYSSAPVNQLLAAILQVLLEIRSHLGVTNQPEVIVQAQEAASYEGPWFDVPCFGCLGSGKVAASKLLRFFGNEFVRCGYCRGTGRIMEKQLMPELRQERE